MYRHASSFAYFQHDHNLTIAEHYSESARAHGIAVNEIGLNENMSETILEKGMLYFSIHGVHYILCSF